MEAKKWTLKEYYERNFKSDSVPVFGLQRLAELAQESSCVAVPLYSHLGGVQEQRPVVLDLNMGVMDFSTDVHGAGSAWVVVFEPDKLPKNRVLNPKELPCDEAGEVNWAKMLEDVHRNCAAYGVSVDWRQAMVTAQGQETGWKIMSLAEAKDYDAQWRANQNLAGFEIFVSEYVSHAAPDELAEAQSLVAKLKALKKVFLR